MIQESTKQHFAMRFSLILEIKTVVTWHFTRKSSMRLCALSHLQKEIRKFYSMNTSTFWGFLPMNVRDLQNSDDMKELLERLKDIFDGHDLHSLQPNDFEMIDRAAKNFVKIIYEYTLKTYRYKKYRCINNILKLQPNDFEMLRRAAENFSEMILRRAEEKNDYTFDEEKVLFITRY